MAYLPDDTKLAGDLDVGRWRQVTRPSRNGTFDRRNWEENVLPFLDKRLCHRYLLPTNAMASIAAKNGEGFAIVSLQCAQIEFLAALREGKRYKYASNSLDGCIWSRVNWILGLFALRISRSRGGANDEHEYSDSQTLYVNFLRYVDPFKEVFETKAKSREFYSNIRCGLLHEAQTKGEWRIQRATSDPDDAMSSVNFDERVLYRDNFSKLVHEYIRSYRDVLLEDSEEGEKLRRAFIRKFDHLASNE